MFDAPNFIDKMSTLARRYEEVSALLGQPEVISKRAEFTRLSREHAELGPLVAAWLRYRKVTDDLAQAKQLVATESDPDMRDMARGEAQELEAHLAPMQHEIKLLLLPKDPSDGKNAILEIRAGTGGDEAAIFAGDLYRMYLRYGERQAWKCETLSMSEGTAGGFIS